MGLLLLSCSFKIVAFQGKFGKSLRAKVRTLCLQGVMQAWEHLHGGGHILTQPMRMARIS